MNLGEEWMNIVRSLTNRKYKEEPNRAEEYNNWNKKYTRRNQKQNPWYRGTDQWTERIVEITQAEQKREEKIKKKIGIVFKILETVSIILTFSLWGHQKEKWEKGAENLFEEIITENLPSLEKETDIQIQETQRVPNKWTQRGPLQDELEPKGQKLKEKRDS